MAIDKNLKIEIRPIPNRNGIKSFSENLEYFSQAHIVPPLVNPQTLKYETGLSKEDIAYLEEQNFPYEFKDDNYRRGQAHPFWESSMVKTSLTSNSKFLFPGKNLIDFVKWKYLLASSYIYKSEAEMLLGTKSEATHYIYNEDNAIELKASILERKNTLIQKVSNLSLKRKRDMVLIILDENTETKNENYLTVKFEEIMNNPSERTELEALLKQGAEEVTLAADIKSAIQKNVLRKTKQGIFFFESNLGFSEDEVAEFLGKTENQEILINIKSKIQ